MRALRSLEFCLLGVMLVGQCLADNLPVQLLSSGTGAETHWAIADAGNFIEDWGVDYGSTSCNESTIVFDYNNGSVADAFSMHSGDIGGSVYTPKVGVAALLMAGGMGHNTAGAAGDVGAQGTFEILPDPLNSSVTSGWLTAKLTTHSVASPGSSTIGGAGIELPMGTIQLSSSTDGNGNFHTQVLVDNVVVEDSVFAFSIQVETLIGVGDEVKLYAGQDGGGSADGPGMTSTGLNTYADSSIEIDGVLPSNPNVTRIRRLEWNEETETYDVGEVIWEYEPEED